MARIQFLVFWMFVSLFSFSAAEESCRKFYLRFKICKESGVLVSVTDLHPERKYFIPKLILDDKEIFSIAEGAFKNLTTNEMLISFANKELDLKPKSFSGLPYLENLEIASGSIPVNVEIFGTLQSLKHLSLKINGAKKFPENSLSGVQFLETLVISNSNIGHISVDTFSNIQTTISSLELNGDNITSIESKSFAAMKGLKTLVIQNNRLSTLTPGIFDGIDGLEHLQISGEYMLRNIPKNIFDGLKNLKKLELANNGIKLIESETFSNLSLENLDLSHNANLEIETGAFQGLSVDVLGIICSDDVKFAKNAFANAKVKTLELSPEGIVINRPSLGLSITTNVLTGNCTQFS